MEEKQGRRGFQHVTLREGQPTIASTKRLVVHAPGGFRVEGLDVATAAEFAAEAVMIGLTRQVRVFVFDRPADMRRGFDATQRFVRVPSFFLGDLDPGDLRLHSLPGAAGIEAMAGQAWFSFDERWIGDLPGGTVRH